VSAHCTLRLISAGIPSASSVRCSAIGRKHKNMLKAVEKIKAILHEVGVMRSDLCRSQYNSYVVCPSKIQYW